MRLLIFIFCFSALYAAETLPDYASFAVYAVHTGTGEVVYEENSSKSLLPASCMKIITTAAALHLLGPEETFQTDLECDGVLNAEGVLEGNLYVRGGGDPCLGSARALGSLGWNEQIALWVHAAQKAGIRRIVGQVVGDASRWETACAPPSWAWEDLGNYYGAGASALSFHENSYALVFCPGPCLGDPAQIVRTEPQAYAHNLRNEVKTGPLGSGDCACIYGAERSSVQYVRGTIPLGVREFSIRGSLIDPPVACAQFLEKALEEKGIAVAHCQLQPSSERRVLHTTFSPAIREIVYWTNQKSINLYAEHLLKRMGEKREGKGSTEAGIRAVNAFWKSQGVDLSGWNLADGSGLSRKNLATAKQFVAILQKMKKSDLFPPFLASLPKELEGICAKSGSMSFVRACVGYADEVAFAILINNCSDTKQMEAKIEEIQKRIVQISSVR